MTIKNRIEKLEKKQPRPPLTLRGIGADGIAELIERDPNFAAAWNEFIAMQKPSEILARADDLIKAGVPATDDQRARVESLRQVTR